jgi:electron transport complex protein RnfB
MAQKDSYEALCKFYEIMVGRIPDRDNFKEALKMTVTPEDLKVFFLLPLSGNMPLARLQKKSDLSPDDLKAHLEHLASEGFVLEYDTDRGHAYERGNPIFMAEQQVRKPGDTPQRRAYIRFFNIGIEGDLEEAIETSTPYYRVLPAEPTICNSSDLRTISIDVSLPRPGEVLPIDIITEMIKRDVNKIGVAQCFCRLTKRHLGEGCHQPLETCFVFNELAQTLIKHGYAREIEYNEAFDILKSSEERGLVHNVDNCSEHIRSLCNCCPCCCIVLKSMNRGETFAGSPSRYVVQFTPERCMSCKNCIERCPTDARSFIDGRMVVAEERCIGCGLCVTTCPGGANAMRPRKKRQKIPDTHRKLYARIGREAILSIIKKKIFRK